MDIIKVENLVSGYDDKIVIKNLSLGIKSGKITTIIGENGCGKSTLLKTIGRVITPKSGKVIVDGKNVHKTNTAEVAKFLGLLPQSPTAPNGLTVEEVVEYGRFPHKKGRGKLSVEDKTIVNDVLEKTNLTEFRDKHINELSGGQRQRVWIAMVLAQETDIILLDEPTTYLDMVYQLEVLELVSNLNETKQITIVMVLHDINHASRFSHELITMKGGELIAQGTPKEIMNQEVLRTVFDIEAIIVNAPNTNTPVCLSYDILRK